MADPVDLMKPWTIKSIATRVQNEITAAAKQQGLTTGQLVEKVWEAWKAGAPAQDLQPLTALISASGQMAEHTALPGEVRRLINVLARAAQGQTSFKPSPTGVYFLRGPHHHGTTVLAYRTAQDRDAAVAAKRLSQIEAEPIDWPEVCRLVEPDADGKRLVWADFPNGGPTRI